MQMTNQEIFNKVREHLLQQNRKAYDSYGVRCAYRSGDGGKCAVGVLIPDEHYTPDMEGSPVGLLHVEKNLYATYNQNAKHLAIAFNASGVPTSALSLLRQLQRVHDSWEPRHWDLELKRIAIRNGLEVPK